MKIFGDGHRHFDGMRVADVAIGCDHDRAGGSAFGNARDQESLGTDDDRSFKLTEFNFGPLEFLRSQPRTGDAKLAASECQRGSNGIDVRSAVHVLFTEDAVGESHEEYRISSVARSANLFSLARQTQVSTILVAQNAARDA